MVKVSKDVVLFVVAFIAMLGTIAITVHCIGCLVDIFSDEQFRDVYTTSMLIGATVAYGLLRSLDRR